MMQCQRCGHENILDLPICEACYALLPGTGLLGGAGDEEQRQALERQRLRAGRHLQNTGQLDDFSVAIYVDTFERPIVVQFQHELTIGRYGPGDQRDGCLNLTPYGGIEAGLSRLHAVLRRVKGGLVITDMGSTNGTWLNNVQLTAYEPTGLYSGDHVRLALLWVTIYYRSAADKQANPSGYWRESR